MKTRIGILLVRSDLVTEAQLARALEVQNFAGGRIGTLLLEREALGEEDLGRTLALQHGCEYVAWSMLSAIAPETIGLLPARFALKHCAIPYECGEGYVKVALRDPDDLRAVDELVFVTGRKILAGVSPEVRILPGPREALRKTSAAPFRDSGREALALAEGRSRRRHPDLLLLRSSSPEKATAAPPGETPPAPESPPAPPAAAWTPFLALRTDAEHPGEPESIPWEDTTGSRSRPKLESVNSPAAPFEEPRVLEVPPFEPALEEKALEPSSPPAGEGFDRVLGATERDAIADAVLAALVRRFPCAAMFASRSQGVGGWAAAGKDVDASGLRSFSVSWAEPSVFLNTRLSRNFYLGPLPPLPRHDELAAAVGGWREEGIIQPVFIGKRPVAFLYASAPSPGSFSASDLSYVRALCDAASTAFANAIRLRKKEI